ncbi:hypothetical protein HDG34_005189 [Paraburkholderia sp. HC6.4b]|uniref:hypothetical protein n=1 Tax=unclassified Paraburkholderia TaxID=2615204 RepID=UPI0016165C2E|nr:MULTISPECIES: hypothetical protein [unclassified Paraburkholderia]MBB5411229.1 hypothetical protein [Paraburkholderia sp. HC6.4b]MBB5454001.1 hypothetical protein [Paraburkholderia sp. Kb1A]
MKCVVELSEAEEMTLQQLSINHMHRDTRMRAAALSPLGHRIKRKLTAEQLGVSGQSICDWLTHGATAACPARWAAITVGT